MTSEFLSPSTTSNEVIELALNLKTLKGKYELKLEILQNRLYLNCIILDQTQNKIDFLDFEKERHIKMIRDISQILRDVRNQMQDDLDKIRAICEDLPYLIGLAALGV